MAEGFVVHIGGGLYLDAAGRITQGPQDARTQVYSPAGGIKFDADKISSTLKDIAKFLEDQETKDKVRTLGLSPKMLEIVLKVGEVGAVALKAAAAATVVMGVALTILDALAKDGGISPELAQLLHTIREDLKAIDDRLIGDQMIGIQAKFQAATLAISSTLQDVVVQQLAGAARVQKLEALKPTVDALLEPLSLLAAQDFSPLYRQEDYKELFALSPLLYARNPDGSDAPLSARPLTTRRFDYRLGVPLLAYVSTAYPALVGAMRPWFRSAGSHALALRRLADTVDAFVIRMYSESLARTVHTAQSLFQCEDRVPLFVPQALGPLTFGEIARRHTFTLEYLVGAVDLSRYTDAWFTATFAEQFANPGYDTGHRGAFDYGWPHGFDPPWNLDQAAALANQQSAADYAELQVASGLVHLVAAAARLRFLSTPPLRSETVRGRVADSRVPAGADEATEATSPRIFPVGVVEAPATLRRFRARTRARITTQEPGHSFQFHYRVKLVTVASRLSNEGWSRRGYDDNVWRGAYGPAAGDPRNRELQVDLNPGALLGSVLLHEGPSPAQPLDRQGTARLAASTFDWYVPVHTPLGASDVFDPSLRVRALQDVDSGGRAADRPGAFGGVSFHALPALLRTTARSGGALPFLEGPGPAGSPRLHLVNDMVDAESMVTALTGPSLDEAERRHVREEQVSLEWQLHWEAGGLEVRLAGRPEDRPFQAWIVVEEDVYSGAAIPPGVGDVATAALLRTELHTAFPCELVNELTLVPARFFRDERDALARGAKLWHDLVRRFSISEEPGPRPPSPVELGAFAARVAGGEQATASLVDGVHFRLARLRAEAPEQWRRALREEGLHEADERPLDAFASIGRT